MQSAVTPDGLALFAAFVRLLPLVTGCNRPEAASGGRRKSLQPCAARSAYMSRLTARWWTHGLACRSLFFTQLVSNEPARRLCGVD